MLVHPSRETTGHSQFDRWIRNIRQQWMDLLQLPVDDPERATFAATPAEDKKRPDAETRWKNLFLAGDWTQTGLPATIEGSIRAGHRAAELINAIY